MKKKIYVLLCVSMVIALNIISIFCKGRGIVSGQEVNSPLEAAMLAIQGMEAAGYDMSQCQLPASLGGGTVGNTVPAAPTTTPTPSTPSPTNPKTNKSCEHEYTKEITTEPTCSEPGTATYTCSKCGDTYTEPIPATDNHDFEEKIIKEATCTTPGQKEKTCKTCGEVEKEAIPPTGHKFGNPQVTEPTCTEPGKSVTVCEKCGQTTETIIPAKGHKESEWEIAEPAGWFSIGAKTKKCVVCGEILEMQEVPQLFPDWTLYISVAAALVIVLACGYMFISRIRMKDKQRNAYVD